jgi:predicted acetyltransferase
MSTDLVEARVDDAGVVAALLDDYLRELVGHREVAVGATDSASYPYLTVYWVEPGRHPFLVRHNGAVVGFALIRGPASLGCSMFQVAEFYIAPESRRLGVGREVVASLWRQFPGAWELQVHARNTAALAFWSSCIEAAVLEPPVVTKVQAADGNRVQFTFHVGPAGGREVAGALPCAAPSRNEPRCPMSLAKQESSCELSA